MKRIFANCVVKEHSLCGQPECGCPCHTKKETTVSVDPTAIANAALSSKKETPVSTATPAPTTTSTVRTARPKLTWQEAKARRESARAVVGYDNTSPIWGMTTAQVVTLLTAALDDPAVDDATKVAYAKQLLTELQKREAAEKIAFA